MRVSGLLSANSAMLNSSGNKRRRNRSSRLKWRLEDGSTKRGSSEKSANNKRKKNARERRTRGWLSKKRRGLALKRRRLVPMRKGELDEKRRGSMCILNLA